MGFGRRRKRFDPSAFDSVISGVKTIYRTKVRPLEEQYMVNHFHYPLLTDEHFDAKPMVLLIGGYSTGKTSFIKCLLEREYQGMHIGPEPTTDRFEAIMYGAEERELPGHALLSNPNSPFSELSKFGNNFLTRFFGCEVPSEFARGCTLIDTPGILAGKKQTDDRQYSYEQIVSWFAPRCDMILLMFDAHKIDISDEYRKVIQHLEGYDDKIRVILNKADSMDPSELLKITSGLSWSLARILKAPEVRRVYVGSFWDQPLAPGNYMNELFEKEGAALLADLASLPRNNTTNKLNDLVYRIRMVRVQALVFDALRREMPKMTGRDKKQRELIAGLEDVFYRVMKTHSLPSGDFPDVARFRHTLATSEACRDFTKFKKLDDKLLGQLDEIMREHIGALMSEFESIPAAIEEASLPARINHQETAPPRPPPPRPPPRPPEPAAPPPPLPPPTSHDPWAGSAAASGAGDGDGASDPWSSGVAGSAAVGPSGRPRGLSKVDGLFGRQANAMPPSAAPAEAPAPEQPVAEKAGHVPEDVSATTVDVRAPQPPEPATATAPLPWAVSAADKEKYDKIFAHMQPEEGHVTGALVAPVLKRSGLSTELLRDIWNLVDVRQDGMLDADWFAVAMHLTMRTKRGHPLPQTIPEALVPPSHR